jgi:ribosome-associated protein
VASDSALSAARRTERSYQLALAAARTAADNRGRDIVILDLRELTPIFDYFVLVTGTSGRQLRAMSEDIDNVLEKQLNDQRMGIEGFQDSRWILLDYGTVVIHLFDAETRTYYDLENLWSGAKRLELAELGIAPQAGEPAGTDT